MPLTPRQKQVDKYVASETRRIAKLRKEQYLAHGHELVGALSDVQDALAAHRDNMPYVHAMHGQITLEEVKYLIVDPVMTKLGYES